MRAKFGVLALSTGSLLADVTVRYKTELKGGFQAMMPNASPMRSAVPKETALFIKGSKSYNQFGNTFSISDSATKEFVVLDPDARKYAVTGTARISRLQPDGGFRPELS